MTHPKAICIYEERFRLVVDLAREYDLSPEVLRGRLKFCKERVKHEGDLIPVATDHELRKLDKANSGSGLNRNKLSSEWLSKPLVK
jgi:hypothetical protein